MRTKNLSINMQKNKLTKSLQVPCNPLFIISKSYLLGKRVLPFTSRKEKPASMTVEAAFVLPLFVFFSLAILAPLEWIDTQRKLQTELERFGESLSQYAYVHDQENGEEEKQWFSDAAAGVWIYGNAETFVDSIQLVQAVVPDEMGNISLELNYRESVPYFSGLMNAVTMSVGVKRRSWIGVDGKINVNADQNYGDEDDESEQFVYVAKNMSRFHWYHDCRYLAKKAQAVTMQQIHEYRSLDGNIYYACETCLGGKEPGGALDTKVYITDWGTRYHKTNDCISMTAFYRKVPLRDVETLGECTVCARRKKND